MNSGLGQREQILLLMWISCLYILRLSASFYCRVRIVSILLWYTHRELSGWFFANGSRTKLFLLGWQKQQYNCGSNCRHPVLNTTCQLRDTPTLQSLHLVHYTSFLRPWVRVKDRAGDRIRVWVRFRLWVKNFNQYFWVLTCIASGQRVCLCHVLNWVCHVVKWLCLVSCKTADRLFSWRGLFIYAQL